jgi:hypothetical protein
MLQQAYESISCTADWRIEKLFSKPEIPAVYLSNHKQWNINTFFRF